MEILYDLEDGKNVPRNEIIKALKELLEK